MRWVQWPLHPMRFRMSLVHGIWPGYLVTVCGRPIPASAVDVEIVSAGSVALFSPESICSVCRARNARLGSEG